MHCSRWAASDYRIWFSQRRGTQPFRYNFSPPRSRKTVASLDLHLNPYLLDLPIPPSSPRPLLLHVLSSVRETYQFTVRAVITVVDDIFLHQRWPTEALLPAVNTTPWMAND
jgi:hypothetical protein